MPFLAITYRNDADVPQEHPVGNLAAVFGLGAICLEGTYAGTATPSQFGGGPDVNRDGVGPEDGLWWSSCDFEADGTPPVTGHAIAWVSGDLASLVTTPERRYWIGTADAAEPADLFDTV